MSTTANMASNNITFFMTCLLPIAIPHGPLVFAVVPKYGECKKTF